MDEDDRVLLVTGGGRGIGAAVARRAAVDGWDVAIGYAHDADAADHVARQVRSHGRRALTVQGDVAEQELVRAMFARVDTELGRLRGLVNNAGIVARRARLDDTAHMDAARWRRMLDVNVVGTLACAQQAVLRMSTRHGGAGGAIVNISSSSARSGAAGTYIDYAASKGAVDSLTAGLALEVATEGVRVNAVRPGVTDTGIHADSGDPGRAQAAAGSIPMGRPGRPEEIAEAVVWLLSAAASYVTGSVLDVSGGR